MKNKLFIIEGLPCSGKSTTSAYVAELLREIGNVCFVDEGTGNHPADYEFHALVPAGVQGDERTIVSLSQYSGEEFERFLQYKIYDFLPWETEMPVMLDKWRCFTEEAEDDTTYVFNCVLLQNPMCETMMRFGFSEKESLNFIERIAEIVLPLNPAVIYLKNDDISESVKKAAVTRNGWLDAVIDYHINGAYGKSIGASGFDGYISCLKERQERELRILKKLPLKSLVLDNPQRDWQTARDRIRRYLNECN